ncbi:MAG TPA: hypothetical protein VME19_18585 [Streptosporangiaceae bacterium]|nr:hypothetical protein [Streptosporangiaceae bacterium]
MPRRSGFVAALAAGACALLAAASFSAVPAGATVSAGSAPSFTALAFPSAAAGWVLGKTTAGPALAQIWHTGTGGSTWQVQWQGAGSPLTISATDPAHAWALIACQAPKATCGRELLATADGGQRWRVAATLPKAVNQVQFFPGGVGLATSDSCLADLGLTHCPGQILLSRDGGAHWTKVLSGAGPQFATANATGQLWAAEVVPSNFAASGPSPSDVKFVTSTDGGHAWHLLGQLANLGALSPEVQLTLVADPSGLAWASVFDQLSCAMHGCSAAELLHSSTGGRTWGAVDLADTDPDECGSDGIVFSAAPDGTALAATGRNAAACGPPYGVVYQYGPSGWQSLPPWQLAQVDALAAVSQDVAYALSDQGVLSRTDDAGQDWTQLLPAPAPAGLVDALSSTTALAAQDQADAGAVLRSDDGGRSWSELSHLPGVVTQLDFWSSEDGVAAAYQPDAPAPWQLWATSDGGSIWEPYGPLPGGNTAIDGPWMAADGHGLLLTVTGGTPWEPGSGSAPVRMWTTSNYGLNWTRGALLPFGGDTLQGPASFAYDGSGRWSGWLVIDTASFAQRVAVTDGGPLRLLPAATPAGDVQVINPGTGFAWDLGYSSHTTVVVLSLARTTDNGRTWLRSSIRLEIPADSAAEPLLGFSDANHGWLVLGNATWRTADGGRTWTPS